ncbi:cytochrome c [Thiomicrorhabdus sp.]|uniref:c-type cytochrome n=1 Tax=Thiomicrorhabdus sp. TaxID=2039724 RepID=UPI00356B2463
MRYQKVPFLLSGLSAAILLASCGGGSSSSGTTGTVDATTSSAVISGTVPGTKIEAFCADGSYYTVNSTDNGTSQHPFSLTVPSGVDCHLVMTTNENDAANRIITPIKIEAGTVTSSVINTQTAFELGYVPLELNIANIIDTNGDGVVDTPLTITPDIPEGVAILDLSFDAMDDDGDGIPNVYEDDDGDGEYNLEDLDDDNNGTLDVDEVDNLDHDGDGIDDLYDRDDDNDGLTDDVDNDDDNDGIPDSEDSDHEDDNETSTSTTVYTPVSAYTASVGRLLASQCAQCHGTNGYSVNSWDSLAGESASELVAEMLEIKAGEEAPIMQAQAHGYTDAEIQALAEWFATQPGSESEED